MTVTDTESNLNTFTSGQVVRVRVSAVHEAAKYAARGGRGIGAVPNNKSRHTKAAGECPFSLGFRGSRIQQVTPLLPCDVGIDPRKNEESPALDDLFPGLARLAMFFVVDEATVLKIIREN